MKNTRWILSLAGALALLSGCVYRGDRDGYDFGGRGWRDDRWNDYDHHWNRDRHWHHDEWDGRWSYRTHDWR